MVSISSYINKFIIIKFDDDNNIVLTFAKEKHKDAAFKVLDNIRKNRKKYFRLIPIVIDQTEDNLVKDFLGYHVNNRYTLFKPSIYKKTIPAFIEDFYVLRFHKPKKKKVITKIKRRNSLKILKKMDIEGFLAEEEDNDLSNRKLFNMDDVGLDVDRSPSRRNSTISRKQTKKSSITVKKKLNKDGIEESGGSGSEVLSDSELSDGEEIQIFITNTDNEEKRPKSFKDPSDSNNKKRKNTKSSKNSEQNSAQNSRKSHRNTAMLDLFEFKTQMRLKSFENNKAKQKTEKSSFRLNPGINVSNQMSLPNYGSKRKNSKGKGSLGSILSGKNMGSQKSRKKSTKLAKDSIFKSKHKKRNSSKKSGKGSMLDISSKRKKSKSKGKK